MEKNTFDTYHSYCSIVKILVSTNIQYLIKYLIQQKLQCYSYDISEN